MEQRKKKLVVLVGVAAVGALALFGGGMGGASLAITVSYQIPPGVAAKVVRVARSVGADPYDLAALIEFESDGWDPSAINPSSNAVGLIQFMPRTLQKLSKLSGQKWTTASVRKMSATDQLELVRFYLDVVAAGMWEGPRGPLRNKQALYMAVFYPKARYWNANKRFPNNVIKANPRVSTVASYVMAVDERRKTSNPF